MTDENVVMPNGVKAQPPAPSVSEVSCAPLPAGTTGSKGKGAAINVEDSSSSSTSCAPGSSGSIGEAVSSNHAFNSLATTKGNDCRVQVAVRIRPLLSLEEGQSESCSADYSSYRKDSKKSVKVGDSHNFTFDHVFDQRSTQHQVYQDAVDPLIGEVVSGYNVTVMAYGQTGSGKTFTMGTSGEYDEDDGGEETLQDPYGERGMTPRCIADLYNRLDDTELSYEVTCSVLELYKDELRDLQRGGEFLDPSQQLRIQEVNGSIVVKNLVEITCQKPEDVLRCLRQASCNRAVGSTEMNAASSRSHMVCRLTIQQFPAKNQEEDLATNKAANSPSNEEAPAITSQLTFVDLAGSERLKKTLATGNRKREGIAINKGLFHLGRVINSNAVGKNDPHIYRVSKLTRLLQDALGGNSKTLFIACVSPAASNTDETLSTLRYANAAKNIQNKAVVNRSPQEIALLRAAVKLDAMTFEYVRVAHGSQGKETVDDVVRQLLSKSDTVRNDVAAIFAKALEKRSDLKNTIVRAPNIAHTSHHRQPLHEQRHHRRSRSSNLPNSQSSHSNRSQTSSGAAQVTQKSGIPGNSSKRNKTSNDKQSDRAPTLSDFVSPTMNDEDRQKFARLIETVEASEKEMQAEHLAMISELETAEGERAEEEASSKKELEEALRTKEAAWQEIKEILVKYPAVQAEAEALKEEVGKIEQERTALEAECAAAEANLKAKGGDGKLVKRLKSKVAELKGLHERKVREAQKKSAELSSMRRHQQRALDMKHEIEELKRQKTVQQRAHQRRIREHREQLAKHRLLVSRSEKKVRAMKRDLANRTRKDATRDAKLLRMSKEITKLKKERILDAKKRRQQLAKRQRRIMQSSSFKNQSKNNRSYSQLHANRAQRAAATIELQAKQVKQMHRRRRNIELRIHELEQVKEDAMQAKETLTEQLDEAFMSGEVSDEDVDVLQTRINETVEKIQRAKQEIKELNDLAEELRIGNPSNPELEEMNSELIAAQQIAEREQKEAEIEREKRANAERAVEEEKRRSRELRAEKNEMVKKIRELESKLRHANKLVQEERMNAMRTPNAKLNEKRNISPRESPVELRRRASERMEAKRRVESKDISKISDEANSESNFTMPIIATSEIAAALEAEASSESQSDSSASSSKLSSNLLTITSPGVKPMEISNGAAERIAKAAALSNSGKKSSDTTNKRKSHPTGTPISTAAATANRLNERRQSADGSNLVFAMSTAGIGPSGKASATRLAKQKFSSETVLAAVGDFVASKRSKSETSGGNQNSKAEKEDGKSGKPRLVFKINAKKKVDIRKQIIRDQTSSSFNDSPSKAIIRDNALSKNCTKKEALRFKKAKMKQKRERQRRQAILQEEHKDRSRDRHGMDALGKRLTREQIKERGNAFMQSGQRNSKPLGAYPGSKGAQDAIAVALGNTSAKTSTFGYDRGVRPVNSPAPFV